MCLFLGAVNSSCIPIVKPVSTATQETFVNFGDDMYAYSAYFDNRTNEVKVFGVIRANYSGLTGITCLLWHNDTEQPQVIQAQVIVWDAHKKRCVTVRHKIHLFVQIKGHTFYLKM